MSIQQKDSKKQIPSFLLKKQNYIYFFIGALLGSLGMSFFIGKMAYLGYNNFSDLTEHDLVALVASLSLFIIALPLAGVFLIANIFGSIIKDMQKKDD